MPKRLVLKRGFQLTARHLAPPGSRAGKKVAAYIRALLEGQAEPSDERDVPLPPIGICTVRRVPGFALALWYVEGEDFIAFYALKRWGDWGS
jgi:hypothetical protein